MDSIHYPYLVEHNKYQELLSTSLEKKGFKVLKIKKSIFKLLEYCIFSKIKILHFHWLHGITNSQGIVKTFFRIFLFISCIIIWKIKSKKIIWTIHNLSSHENNRDKLEKIFYIFVSFISDFLIVHSKLAIPSVRNKYKVKDNKIRHIPHGNYSSLISLKKKNYSKNTGKFVFLFFGLIRPYKGVLGLIESFKRINIEAYLTIAGLCKSDNLNRNIIKTINSDKNIKYINKFINEKHLNQLVLNSDVVVLPYVDAFTSGSVVYALSASKPLILPKFISYNEYSDKSNTFIYDNQKNNHLDYALLEAFNSNNLIEMGFNSYKRALNLDWDNIGKSVLKLYLEALN